MDISVDLEKALEELRNENEETVEDLLWNLIDLDENIGFYAGVIRRLEPVGFVDLSERIGFVDLRFSKHELIGTLRNEDRKGLWKLVLQSLQQYEKRVCC